MRAARNTLPYWRTRTLPTSSRATRRGSRPKNARSSGRMPPTSYRGSVADACNRCCSRQAILGRLRHALSSLLQICQHFLGMALGLHFGENLLDPAVRPDDECSAGDSHHFLAIHVLLLHHSETLANFLFDV